MKQGQKLALQNRQRLTVMGRLRMADWIQMPEREFAHEVEKLEKDPLFQKLYFGDGRIPGAVRRQRWPGGKLAGSFYEIDERTAAGAGERVGVEEFAAERGPALAAIKLMGQKDFERYFIHGEDALTLEEIGRRTNLSPEEVRSIHELVVELGARAEFEGKVSAPTASPGRQAACLAKISLQGGVPAFEFYAPYWARGLYQIRFDLLEKWKAGGLNPEERRHLPALLKRLETVNLRQSTLFRLLETVARLQADYLKNERPEDVRPISLRQLAKRLDLAPSTVSRAFSRRSVRLPSERELPLIAFVPGRRSVLRELLGQWLGADSAVTDAALAARLKSERGIAISRRTVNAVRHELKAGKRR
jgi:transcriptional regulator with XRE-family HTH domain